MKINQLILLFLLSFISCTSDGRKMARFVRCISEQVGKKYNPDTENPFEFSNEGLILYCRNQAGFPEVPNLFDRTKTVRTPQMGVFAYGIIENNEVLVSYDLLGVVISSHPTYIVSVDPRKLLVFKQELTNVIKPKYTKMEYHYFNS